MLWGDKKGKSFTGNEYIGRVSMVGLNKQSEYKAKNNEVCLFPSYSLRTAESGIPPLTRDSYHNCCLQATALTA